jgi:hypothetical protein
MHIGSASVLFSISDTDGFRVKHGTDKVTLQHVPVDKLKGDEWERLWTLVNLIVAEAANR